MKLIISHTHTRYEAVRKRGGVGSKRHSFRAHHSDLLLPTRSHSYKFPPLEEVSSLIIPVLTLMPFTFCGSLLGPLCNPPASALPLFLTPRRPPSPFFHHRSAYILYNFMSVETCSNWIFPGLFHSVVYREAYPVILNADSHLFAVSESIPRHRHTAIHYELLMATGLLSFIFVSVYFWG